MHAQTAGLTGSAAFQRPARGLADRVGSPRLTRPAVDRVASAKLALRKVNCHGRPAVRGLCRFGGVGRSERRGELAKQPPSRRIAAVHGMPFATQSRHAFPRIRAAAFGPEFEFGSFPSCGAMYR